MTRDEARVLISDLIEWYTEDIAERLGMSMGKETYMDALEVLWHGPEGDLISRADAIEAVDRIKSTDNWQGAVIALLSALPSAEAVTHGRLIDADALSEKLCDTTIFIKDGEVFQRMINDAPTVSAEAVDVTHDIPEYCSWSQTYTNMVQGAMSKASADAVQGWIPLVHDEMTTDFPYEHDGEWVIVTDGKDISVERIKKDAYDHFYPNGRWFELDDAIAWMPLPTPYKGGEDE